VVEEGDEKHSPQFCPSFLSSSSLCWPPSPAPRSVTPASSPASSFLFRFLTSSFAPDPARPPHLFSSPVVVRPALRLARPRERLPCHPPARAHAALCRERPPPHRPDARRSAPSRSLVPRTCSDHLRLPNTITPMSSTHAAHSAGECSIGRHNLRRRHFRGSPLDCA